MIKDNKNYNEKVKPNTEFLSELKSKLPQFFVNEKFDEEGNLVSEGYFDIDKFQESLRDNNINEIKEGYQLSFIGKDYAKKQSGEKPTTVVVPDNKHNQEEINKNSKNLFFTGDNLEVLRHLQNNYRNSIDVIYIDPPYNTGNDGFVYPDSFEYSDEVLQDVFGLNENELAKLKSIQGKSTHSAWLTFMYPRIALAKRLLSIKGVMFVSIDENENSNLTLLLSDVFGQDNVEEIVWSKVSGYGSAGQGKMKVTKRFRKDHEYIVVAYKNKINTEFNKVKKIKDYLNTYGNIDNDVRGPWISSEICKSQEKSNSNGIRYYTIKLPNGKDITRQWHIEEDEFKELDKDNRIYWGNGNIIPRLKRFVNEAQYSSMTSILDGYSQTDGNNELNYYFGMDLFNNPKPSKLVINILEPISNEEKVETVLDFFAGSGTTADAVMQLNAEDGGNRQFIMVQIDEPTYISTERNTRIARKGSETAFNAGYMSIDEISRERIKRASQKIRDEKGLTLPENFDGGFKHYRVVKPTQASINDLETYDPNTGMFVDSKGMPVAFSESGFDDMIQPFSSEGLGVLGDATGVDTILTTWMIQDGYKLDEEFTTIEIDGYDAFYIDSSRIYLISNSWQSKHTRELLNMIGKYELTVQTIVLYGYSFGLESIRELEIGLKQLPNKVNLVKRY